MNKNKKTVICLVILAVLIVVIPFCVKRNAEFGGSDDAGSVMIENISGNSYEPWFTPVLEQFIGGELPGELESLLFCLQTGIGVGVIAFVMGRMVERKNQEKLHAKEQRQGNIEETEEK